NGAGYVPSRVLKAPDRLLARLVEGLKKVFPDAQDLENLDKGSNSQKLEALVTTGLTLPEVAPEDAQLRIAEPLKNSLGLGGIEPGATFSRSDGEKAHEVVDIAEELLRLIDQSAPGALSRTPGLRQAIIGQFAGEGWTGKLDRMLADGFDMDFPVKVNGLSVKPLRVRITAKLSDGDVIGRAPNDGSIGQDYVMADHRISRGYGRSWGGGGDFNGIPGLAPKVAADVGHGGSSWANAQNARV